MTSQDDPRADDEPSDSAPDSDARRDDAAPSVVEPRGRKRRRWPWVLLGVLIAPFVLLALWTVIALNYSYSSGDRAGYVQKFSRKGWICKTWEGELAMVNIPGAMQERFEFSVRNDSIARLIQDSMGKQVSLTYEQHIGIPTSCFGETQYYVTGIRSLTK